MIQLLFGALLVIGLLALRRIDVLLDAFYNRDNEK